MTILNHPNINRSPRNVERMMARGLEIDSFLKQQGVNVFQTLRTVSISSETQTASDEFFKVVKRGVRI